MSWTDFKNKHLFSVNLAIVASLTLWQLRKDFTWHPVIIAWLVLGFFIPLIRRTEYRLLLTIGKINGFLLLSLFYFLFFTPFSFLYRWFFRHRSFRESDSTFEVKTEISPFGRPF